MKISYRILLINFAVVVLVLGSSAFGFYSIMHEVLTSQQSQSLLNSANNLAYTLREVQQSWRDDLQYLKNVGNSASAVYNGFNPHRIDFLFRETSEGELVSLYQNNSNKIPSDNFTLAQFTEENPLVLINSYKDNSGSRYYYGKIISEEFLNMIAQRINSETAVIVNGVPEEMSNKLKNQSHLKVLLDAGKVLKNKDNYKTFNAPEQSADFFAVVYKTKESLQKSGVQFLVFNSINEVVSLRSSIRDVLMIIGTTGVILSLILTFLFTDRIRKDIKRVSEATKVSKDGRFISRINLKSKDELGQLAASFNNMIDEVEKYQNARNEYSEFLTLLNQNPSLSEISDAALKKIIRSCGFTAGAIYTVYNQEISLTSSYGLRSGISVRENNDLFYTVTRSKEPLEFNFTKESPVVSSGALEISVKYLLIQPIVYNSKVIAILELAAVEPPIPETREYISNIHDQLAIGLTNAGALVQLENLVSELKMLNEEYQKQNMQIRKQNETLTDLHASLKEKADELEIQKEKAEESTKLKSQFLAGVSHELRTPMNSILGLTELIINDAGIERKHRERLQVVLKNGNRLMTLINEILDLSKIEAGKMQLNREEIIIEEVISAAESAVSPLAQKKNIQFTIDRKCDTGIIINSDREKITQVLINLLDNAVKFTERGTVTFAVSMEDQLLKFKVTDTGIGIAEKNFDVIFNEFRQVDGSNTRKYGGTGLGLAICKKMADLLKAYISVESTPGRGSVFTFAVPVSLSPEGKLTFPDSLDERDERKKKVLVVGIDAEMRYTIGQYLVSRNYEVLFADNAAEALVKIQKLKPFAVTLEMNLPDGSSWDLLNHIKRDIETAAVPLILLSADTQANVSYAPSASDYISGPLDKIKFTSLISQIEQRFKRKIEKIFFVNDAGTPSCDLTAMGFTAVGVSNPNEAVDLIAKQRPDIIIGSILMKEYDGLYLANLIKNSYRDIPVVLELPEAFTRDQKTRLTGLIQKFTVQSKAHPLDLLKVVRDRLEIQSDEILKTEEIAGPVINRYADKSLSDENELLGEVMIVDDDSDTLFTLNEIVKSCRCKTILAGSGKECLQILDYSSPGLILLDIMMPEMDGFQTLKNIRRKIKSQNIPVFAVTAKAMAEDKEIILKFGFDDYISKPVNSGVMAFKIEKLFSKIKMAG